MLDIDDERQSARLRLMAAIVAAGAGAWLAWVDESVWLRLVALASLVFAGRFWASYRKARRLDPSAPQYLEITTEHVTLPWPHNHAQQAQLGTQRTIPFEHVTRIELDEDRIAVVLCLGTGEELAIEPVYGRLTPRELAETLHRYSRARSGLGCKELNP